MPAGEDWNGQFLYVYNFNYNNLALKTAPGELVIPAMSVGIFLHHQQRGLVEHYGLSLQSIKNKYLE